MYTTIQKYTPLYKPNWYIRGDIPNFGVMMVERLLQTLLAGCRVIKRPFREVWNVVGKDKRLEVYIISEAERAFLLPSTVCLSFCKPCFSQSIYSRSVSLSVLLVPSPVAIRSNGMRVSASSTRVFAKDWAVLLYSLVCKVYSNVY